MAVVSIISIKYALVWFRKIRLTMQAIIGFIDVYNDAYGPRIQIVQGAEPSYEVLDQTSKLSNKTTTRRSILNTK